MQSDNNEQMFTVSIDGEEWKQVASLSNAGVDDKVFALDPASGTVRFGEGEHGQQPPSGAAVTVSYREGGGTAGEVSLTTSFRWPAKSLQFCVALGEKGAGIRKVESAAVEYAGEKRPNYFAGRLLTAEDLSDEQAYLMGKLRRHNRLLHGWGVVTGLEVSPGTSDTSIVVAPGLALDAEGREIIVHCALVLEVGERASPQYVLVEYTERETDRVIVAGSDEPLPSRIEEGASLRLESDVPDNAIAIARLLRDDSGWRVDRDFQPRRPR